MDLGPNASQRSVHAIRIISIKKLVQGVYRKRYYPVGYNDGHIVAAIWDQVSWLLCSTEAHIWKNPASHFAPLPVPTQMKYSGFFVLFYSVNSVHIVIQRGAEISHQNQNFLGPEWHNKAYILHFAVNMAKPRLWPYTIKFWHCFLYKISSE